MQALASDTTPPFIIWTLQRTGGTNLAVRLMGRSQHPKTEHEPFNSGRVYGDITQHWIATHDRVALDASVTEICRRGVLIKHCVEMVPWQVTEALVRATTFAGYRHLFLYRRNAADRLLSLYFAQQTGVWGPQSGENATIIADLSDDSNLTLTKDTEESTNGTLPVDNLIQHERACADRLARTWSLLKSINVQPVSLAYEDVYQVSDNEQGVCRLLKILSHLRLASSWGEDRKWGADVIGKGDQGTRHKYDSIVGADRLRARAAELCPPFSPDSPCVHTKNEAQQSDWVRYAKLDTAFVSGRDSPTVMLGGVVALTDAAPAGGSLVLRSGGRDWLIPWGMPSPWMAKKFGGLGNTHFARFKIKVDAGTLGVDAQIVLRIANSEYLIFQLKENLQ